MEFSLVFACQMNVCPPLPQLELTKPLNTKDSYQENYFVHYQCVDGYVRMAGTSSRIICKQIDQVLQWKGPTLKCIRGNTEKSSATAIYVGVGGVVVTVLLVAAFGVLMFGRRKWMQRLDLSPTPDEVVQINVVT
uniref:Sushi domain-containing protein n=1 Tax=Hucho hucho TaxID=62062 RepID=A0A4W5Q4A8_9TELE